MALEMGGFPGPPCTGHEVLYAFSPQPSPYKKIQGSEGVKIQYASSYANPYRLRGISRKLSDSYTSGPNSDMNSGTEEFYKPRTSSSAAYLVPKSRIVDYKNNLKPFMLN